MTKGDYKAMDQMIQVRTNALKVLVLTPHIRDYLLAFDPKALEQACHAVGLPVPTATEATSELRFELEELMGGGEFRTVWETKEQANYESPDHLSFATEGEAAVYAKANWRNPSHVRVIAVRTVRRRDTIEEG